MHLNSVAIGYSERCRSLNDLGRVYYYQQEYQKAHEIWMEAATHAEKIAKLFKESKKLYAIMRNLLDDVYSKKRILHALDVLKRVEEFFKQDPECYGVMCHNYAMIAYECGDLVTYKDKMYEALEAFRSSENVRETGKAEHNVAYIAYQMGEYRKAKELFETAIRTLECETEPKSS